MFSSNSSLFWGRQGCLELEIHAKIIFAYFNFSKLNKFAKLSCSHKFVILRKSDNICGVPIFYTIYSATNLQSRARNHWCLLREKGSGRPATWSGNVAGATPTSSVLLRVRSLPCEPRLRHLSRGRVEPPNARMVKRTMMRVVVVRTSITSGEANLLPWSAKLRAKA